MSRQPDKFLLICLIFLLGLSPVQGAITAFITSPDQGEAMHHMAAMQDDAMTEPSEMASSACAGCEQSDCCSNSTCAFGQCGSCLLLLPTNYYTATPSSLELFLYSNQAVHQSRIADSLFRPPRG